MKQLLQLPTKLFLFKLVEKQDPKFLHPKEITNLAKLFEQKLR